MRVGLLIYGDINTSSGGYLYDRQLVSYLRNHGDTVEIISLRCNSYIRDLCCANIPASLRQIPLDILIQDELVYPRMFNLNAKLQSLLQCPIISLVHLIDSSRPQGAARCHLAQWAERRYLRSVDALILNSRYTRGLVRKLLGNRMPPHIIARPAADHLVPSTSAFSGVRAQKDDSGRNNSRLNILYAGNVIQQKGLHVLLDALETLEPGRYHLTVAGRVDMEPRYVERIRRTIKARNLEDAVLFRGVLKDSDLIACYRDHDLLVLPSVNEAYGIVYLEAQGFGLPVIGTLAGGAKEIIEPGINGYLIKPGDSKALATCLTLLLNDRDHFRWLSANAREYYLKHPDWNTTCAKIRSLLLHTLSNWNLHL
jgi:glycosyltransferase involved in cell wall biosynthesis